MDSLILCYAPADESFARWLAGFLEMNLPLAVSCDEAIVGPDLDLMEAAERALSAEVALLLLSPSSVPKVWQRKTWEPLFFEKPKEFQTLLGFVLVSECTFPAMLRREHFFDARESNPAAARGIRRWLLRPPATHTAPLRVAPELEGVYAAVADQPGSTTEMPPELATQFATEFAADFEASYHFNCAGRSRAGIIGDIGSALGLPMSSTVDENHSVLRDWCARHRVLFVLSEPGAEAREFAVPGSRVAVILTGPIPGGLPCTMPSGAGDAVRRFHQTLSLDLAAALQLGWQAVNLLKAQGRCAETLEVLDAMSRIARDRADSNAATRIEREQFWIRLYQDESGGHALEPRDLTSSEQLKLPFAERLPQ
jgi:hypothetical protein